MLPPFEAIGLIIADQIDPETLTTPGTPTRLPGLVSPKRVDRFHLPAFGTDNTSHLLNRFWL
jgi:hypothetical protein